MKPHRDAAALAAALTSAAATPVPLPERASPIPANSSVPPEASPSPSPRTKKVKAAPDTVGITLAARSSALSPLYERSRRPYPSRGEGYFGATDHA